MKADGMKDEKEEVEYLTKKQDELQKALAHEQLKNLALNALIECVEEYYQIDVKKNFGDKASRKSTRRSKNSG